MNLRAAGSAGSVRVAGALSLAQGAALIGGKGDAFGTAVQNGENVDVAFFSPEETLLRLSFADLDVTAPESAPIGVAARGARRASGVTIRNVVPGGGLLPEGAVVTIEGSGFVPDAHISIGVLSDLPVSYISSTMLQVKLPSETRLDGALITLTGKDNSAEYLSYLRGNPQGASTDELIGRAIPLFPGRTAKSAALPAQLLTSLDSNYVIGLALQNPGLSSAEIEISTPSGASARVLLPAGARISRELGELLGGATASGVPVYIKASLPIQALGLLGDRRAGTVLPVALVLE